MGADVRKACLPQELLLKRRAEILHALCSSGSAEYLEGIVDMLLAQGELGWEDYQNILVPGRALHSNARQLLDVVYAKGADSCGLFFSVVKQVLPDVCEDSSFSSGWPSSLNHREKHQRTSTDELLIQRPSLVCKLQGCIDGVLGALVKSGHFSSADCDGVRLPVYTPSQQARRLLDYARSKGESAASVVLQYVEQGQESGSSLENTKPTLTKEFIRYQLKLSSSISAQTRFISTYGGTSHISLDDIYTEVQLELPNNSADIYKSMDFEDIVGPVGTMNEDADTVLVSGEAGSGKSTWLQRMHLLWAQGAALQDFLLLFPFSCRRLNSEHRDLSVQELLFQHCCWPDREQEEIFQFILYHPHLVLFTFDGLDELKQSFADEHRVCCPSQRAPVHVLLFNLLQGSLMKGVRKVVTSRPEAAGSALKKHLHKEVHLQGFSQSSIDCFVRKHHSDPNEAAKVLESLQANTALLGLCHSPVLCWIVSQCHKELLGCGDGSPKTITDVYLMILQHFFQHHSSFKSAMGVNWLQKNIGTVLHLGQLAFEGISNCSYIFSVTDMERCGVTETDICMGFLIQSKNISPAHIECYEFLHITMQCFLAALYAILSSNTGRSAISKLFELQEIKKDNLSGACFGACLHSSNTDKIFEEHSTIAETPNLQMTATFVSGLLSQRYQKLWFSCSSSILVAKKARQAERCLSKGMQQHFRSIPQPVQGEKKSMHAMPQFVWLIKCIYEMQESRIANEAMSKLEVDHLKLTYCNIGPVECTALAYVLQHLKNPVGLQLDNNSVGDVGVEQLLPCIHICNSLYLRNNNITDEGIHKLIDKVIHLDSFQKIALYNNRLTDVCTQHFSYLLKTRQNFLSLRLGNNNITAKGAKHLAEGLKLNHSLQYLGLWGNKVGDKGAEALAEALQNSKSIVWLSLVGNGIGSAGACALANIIRNSTSLEELWLTENCITRTGVESLTQALRHNDHVKSVWLKNNSLSSAEVEEMQKTESRLVF